MRLLYQDKIYENDILIEENLIKIINELQVDIKKNKMIFSHFRIDGVESYLSIDEIITKYKKTDTTIEVCTVTIEEHKNELLTEGYRYLLNSQNALIDFVEKAYQGDERYIWNNIGNLTEGIQFLLTVMKSTFEKKDIDEITFYLNAQLEQLVDAIENSDITLIADLIQYEIIPLFEKISGIILDKLEVSK